MKIHTGAHRDRGKGAADAGVSSIVRWTRARCTRVRDNEEEVRKRVQGVWSRVLAPEQVEGSGKVDYGRQPFYALPFPPSAGDWRQYITYDAWSPFFCVRIGMYSTM